MSAKTSGIHFSTLLVLCCVLAADVMTAFAQSNISPADKWSWSENTGWTNWFDPGAPGAGGAKIDDYVLEGFIWNENLGWLFLGSGSPTSGSYYSNASTVDTGVNIAANGDLWGFAWGENIGWVNFDTISTAGPLHARVEMCCSGARLHGYAWGENIGWINLDDPVSFVALGPGVAQAKADLNADTARDGLDVEGFLGVYFSPSTASAAHFCAADMDSDGTISVADLDAFVICLLYGTCGCS